MVAAFYLRCEAMGAKFGARWPKARFIGTPTPLWIVSGLQAAKAIQSAVAAALCRRTPNLPANVFDNDTAPRLLTVSRLSNRKQSRFGQIHQ